MAKRISRTEQAFECLKQNPGQRFTPRQIASWILENYRDQSLQKLERSMAINTESELTEQMAAEINPKPLRNKSPNIKVIEGPPRKFYYSEVSDDEEIEQDVFTTARPNNNKEQPSLSEHDLYQKLSDYLFSEAQTVYTKRIDEKRSKNTKGAGGNKWLYPDVVGIEVLNEDWIEEIKKCVKVYADKKTKLWSFEVKLKINRSNLRESFFQAVSNSSWANFGYLVASEIRTEAMSELRILSSLHGIGFILLDVNDLSNSQISIPAKERAEIDWSTANRLAEENKDFEEYIQRIRGYYQTDIWNKKEWDGKELD